MSLCFGSTPGFFPPQPLPLARRKERRRSKGKGHLHPLAPDREGCGLVEFSKRVHSLPRPFEGKPINKGNANREVRQVRRFFRK